MGSGCNRGLAPDSRGIQDEGIPGSWGHLSTHPLAACRVGTGGRPLRPIHPVPRGRWNATAAPPLLGPLGGLGPSKRRGVEADPPGDGEGGHRGCSRKVGRRRPPRDQRHGRACQAGGQGEGGAGWGRRGRVGGGQRGGRRPGRAARAPSRRGRCSLAGAHRQ